VAVHYFELLGTIVFAITGVLAVTRRGLDVFGAVVLGIVTALGGGTVRDLLLNIPVFWIDDRGILWAAILGSLAAFWIAQAFRNANRLLVYLDALGAALFAVLGANKVLLLGVAAPIAVMMGVLTGIGGGLIRDVLAGRPTLLMSRDVYATPILAGCIVFVSLRSQDMAFVVAGLIAGAMIFSVRALAIYFHLEMPAWLTHRGTSNDMDDS
jgi:uncharacterized membrane protein YeiH